VAAEIVHSQLGRPDLTERFPWITSYSLPASWRTLRRVRSAVRKIVVNKHRSRTPGLREGQPVDLVRENCRTTGVPIGADPAPPPERISSCYIKALRSSELGSRVGAYSHLGAPTTPLASNSSCFRLRDILSKLERPLTEVSVLFKAAATIMVDLPFAQSARRRLSSSVVQVFRCGRFISL
jgi:hypothetical protein